MSVEKSHLVRKAYRGFEAIADALVDDDGADYLIDDAGNVYALVDAVEIEKGIPGAMKSAGMFGLKPNTQLTERKSAYVIQRKKAYDAGRERSIVEGREQRKLSRTNLDKLT
jgi:hypothetical protein